MHLFGSLKLLMALLGPSWPLLGPIWSKTGPKLVHQLFENLSNKCLNCPNCPKTCPRKNTKKPSPRRRANNLQQKCLWQRGGRPRARLRQSHKRTLHRRRLQRRGLGEPQDRPSGVGANVAPTTLSCFCCFYVWSLSGKVFLRPFSSLSKAILKVLRKQQKAF